MTWKIIKEDTFSHFKYTGDPKLSFWRDVIIFKNKISITAVHNSVHLLKNACEAQGIVVTVDTTNDAEPTIECKDVRNFSKIIISMLDQYKNQPRIQICSLLERELITVGIELPQLAEIFARLGALEAKLAHQAAVEANRMTPASFLLFNPTVKKRIAEPKININQKTFGITELQKAVILGDVEAVTTLIAQGADLDIIGFNKESDQHDRFTNCKIRIFEKLNYDFKDLHGTGTAVNFALGLAILTSSAISTRSRQEYTKKYFRIANILLEAGADPRGFNYEHYLTKPDDKRFMVLPTEQQEYISNCVALNLYYGANIPTTADFKTRHMPIFYIPPGRHNGGGPRENNNQHFDFACFSAKVIQAFNRMLHNIAQQELTAHAHTGPIGAFLNSQDIFNQSFMPCIKVKTLEEIVEYGNNRREQLAERDRTNAAKLIQKNWKTLKFRKHMNRQRTVG